MKGAQKGGGLEKANSYETNKVTFLFCSQQRYIPTAKHSICSCPQLPET